MTQKDIVLLLYPKVGISPLYPQPPLSLLAISPYIEMKGLNAVIIDQRVEKDYEQKIKELLPRTLFAAITSMTGEQIKYAVKLIGLIKGLSPRTPVVFGGVHASLMPGQCARADGIDIVAVGEGEAVMPCLIDYFLGKKALSDTSGLFWLDNETVASSTPMAELAHMDNLPIPSWHLIDTGRYTDITVQAGRGCPYGCSFCYNLVFNQGKWRPRRPEAIVEEVEHLQRRYGVRDLMFIDDNFFTSFERVGRICELIIEKGLDIRWRSSFRADYYKRLTPELVNILKRSGLGVLFIGAESGSTEVLKKIRKGFSVEDIISMAEVSKKYGLLTQVSFMAGFHFESPEDRRMTYDLMDRIKKINPMLRIEGINVYTPYPGNDLYEESVRHGFKEPESLSGWASFVFNANNLTWLSQGQSRRLENISFISRFYFWHETIKERFVQLIYFPFYWFLRASALLRWRLRFFGASFEWDIFRFVRRYIN